MYKKNKDPLKDFLLYKIFSKDFKGIKDYQIRV